MPSGNRLRYVNENSKLSVTNIKERDSKSVRQHMNNKTINREIHTNLPPKPARTVHTHNRACSS